MKSAVIVSFDGTESCRAPILSPANRDEVRALIETHDRFSIRGSGLSYCQAGAAEATPSISTRRLDRIINVDVEAATVKVEAGCSIGALLRHVVARGFWFPVLPGHPEISVGGCAAFNTHGKTQHDIGQFSDHVQSLTLLHPDRGEIECGPDNNDEIFGLTMGGMGLTGWILDLTLRLQPLAGETIRRRVHVANDFVHAVEIMESRDRDDVHLYSWNDGNRRGDGFGRGVVYEEEFVPGHASPKSRYRVLRPERRGRLFPVSGWNRPTTTVINSVFRMIESHRGERSMPALDAAFPINGKEGYFHAFGRPGFHEYQIIVPRDQWSNSVEEVGRLIETCRACVTLASLKLFRGEAAHLWFRGDGVCLTLDGPANDRTRSLFAALDDLAVELGAPVNLSKDSRLTAAAAARIFPGYAQFKRQLNEYDPARRIDSELRRRIDV